jgi:hypothetical protein
VHLIEVQLDPRKKIADNVGPFLGWMLENDITSVLEETFSIVREQV